MPLHCHHVWVSMNVNEFVSYMKCDLCWLGNEVSCSSEGVFASPSTFKHDSVALPPTFKHYTIAHPFCHQTRYDGPPTIPSNTINDSITNISSTMVNQCSRGFIHQHYFRNYLLYNLNKKKMTSHNITYYNLT